jgi:hypothetical protein
MAFSHLFRRYSTSNEIQSASYAYMDENSIAETLLDELESQCQSSFTVMCIHKRNSQVLNSSDGVSLATQDIRPSKRHASVDYSWLTPNKNLLQSSQEVYHLSDIIKMELSELISYVVAEDCTHIINQFRRHIRAQTKSTSPENVIALFRKTLADYIDEKPKHRTSNNQLNESMSNTSKSNHRITSGISAFVKNNRINPKHQFDDEQHCIAELTEISIASSSNDGLENPARVNHQT